MRGVPGGSQGVPGGGTPPKPAQNGPKRPLDPPPDTPRGGTPPKNGLPQKRARICTRSIRIPRGIEQKGRKRVRQGRKKRDGLFVKRPPIWWNPFIRIYEDRNYSILQLDFVSRFRNRGRRPPMFTKETSSQKGHSPPGDPHRR